jgi:formate hydrogenlyase transcriptional activator
LHRKTAALMMTETPDNEQAILAAANQLIHVSNDLEGCGILLDAGDRYRKKGDSKKALACYEKAIHDLRDKEGRPENLLFIKTVIGYAKDRFSLENPELTLSLLKDALTRAERVNDNSLQSIVLLNLASMEYTNMRYTSAKKYFHRGRSLAKDIKDPRVERTLEICSVLHYCYTGRFQEAIKNYESIGSLFSKNTPGYRLSLKVSIMLGVSYAYIGQIPQAMGMLNQLRDDALALNDHDAAARASIYIAFALIMKNDLENAAIQIRETLKASKKLDLFTKGFASLMQANIYFEKNDFTKSHEYLKTALKIRNKHSFTLRGQLFEFCLAMERGNYPAIAELSLENEIKLSIDIGNIYNQGIAYRYLGIWQQDKKEPPETILKSLHQSLALLEESGARLEIARTKEALGRYYLQQENTPKAKEYVEAAAKIFLQHGERRVADDLKHFLKDFHITEDLVEEILNVGPDVVEIRDIKKVAQRILSAVIKITGAERGAIFLFPGETETADFELLTATNLTLEDMEKSDFELSKQIIKETGKTGLGKLDNVDISQDQGLKTDTIKSRICVPLLLRGKTIGVLYHDNRLFRSTFKKQDLKILSYFASLAAISLDNAQSYEKIQSLNQRLYEEKNYLEEQQLEHLHFEDFVAASPAIKKVLALVERVADTESTVLILGDTGVGKEMVARAIHQHSSRRDKPFIRVNCSAFPESLIASELFGHEKGSFTGAGKRRVGRFELADTGTLFLDEIGDISMDIQVRLLRVIQTRKFERVGASESIHSDFRLLTATNRNLEKAVAEGRFRQDLFYRLNVFPIYVPPLKERIEDISPLACYFLKKHSNKMKKAFKGIPEKEMDKLLAYHWPGNVRELENIIERGVILNADGLFSMPELSVECGDTTISGQPTLEEMERRYIFDTLQQANWKIYGPGGAAKILGLNHSTLYSRMKKLKIQNPNKK